MKHRLTDQSHYTIRQEYRDFEIGYDEAISLLMKIGFDEAQADAWLLD